MKKILGFSLIELLVVVSILGIIAVIGIVAYDGYLTSSGKKIAEYEKASTYYTSALAVFEDVNNPEDLMCTYNVDPVNLGNFVSKNSLRELLLI